MAPGAGKTYARLAEGRRLADAGAGLLTRQGVQVARAVLEEVTNRLHWPG